MDLHGLGGLTRPERAASRCTAKQPSSSWLLRLLLLLLLLLLLAKAAE